jgi:cyclopropane fatty-acyl-phospholipid synthase-like methyltransferase
MADPRRILDLPSGHGRVLRALRTAFPRAEITASDRDQDAVTFCARTFRATGVITAENVLSTSLGGPYDLIWCGSLLTHLDSERWGLFFALFERYLGEEGVLMFTTHGNTTARWLRKRQTDFGLGLDQMYGISAVEADRMLAAFDTAGFAYMDYPQQSSYGLSLSSSGFVVEAVRRTTRLRRIAFLESGWDHHQDVFAYMRV